MRKVGMHEVRMLELNFLIKLIFHLRRIIFFMQSLHNDYILFYFVFCISFHITERNSDHRKKTGTTILDIE